MMFPDPDYVPHLQIARAALRDNRFIDIELRPEAAEAYRELGIRQGDVVRLSAAPVEPEAPAFVVDKPGRSGLVVTVRPEGPAGEEGRICQKQLLTGSKYTLLGTGRIGEFTVHRHVSIEGLDRLKLHFAHGSQLQKLQMTKGSVIKVKERPCGIEEWEVLDVHTENLDRCPNCRTGLSGPRSKDFDPADLCAPGTQWALVQPSRPPPQGVAFFSERSGAPAAASTLRLLARPDPRK
mmetsp:Transcript_106184/g.342537  ORF Transcript_106184/g.342537 Transcript_106184/m.342537 type:complete len:237 (-) Transcript_106184:39-749(-)